MGHPFRSLLNAVRPRGAIVDPPIHHLVQICRFGRSELPTQLRAITPKTMSRTASRRHIGHENGVEDPTATSLESGDSARSEPFSVAETH